ncbi:MAG: acetolactate synthase small subunit [Desulfamplus sp.]
MSSQKYILSILVDNEPGVLSRIAGLFSGRGYNIESLSVAQTAENSELSRITMVTVGDEHIIEQITKQLHKLINVITVNDLTEKQYVHRELMLIKVNAKPENRAEILRIVDIFRCRVVDVGHEHYIIEVSGDEGKLEAFIDLLRPMGIIETARTGLIALTRDKKNKVR